MKIDILTLFPEMFKGPFDESMIKRAQDEKLVQISIQDLRKWAKDKHKTVDARPYGGGPGMIVRVDIIDSAISNLQLSISKQKTRSKSQIKSKIVLLSAKGQKYTQKKAQELSKLDHLILIAGHYEGVDHRVHEHLVDEVISIGDYILTGGEIPTMVLVDSIVRLIPRVLNPESLKNESFSHNTQHATRNTQTEYPQYTRPEEYKGWKVPEILLSGNHAEIEKWRQKQS
jgi:tRNA (guanine37-N1)-methyltransferase